MGKITSSVTEIPVAKTEISVTGLARLLISTPRNVCKEKSGEARSRKPSQPGRLGSNEEAQPITSIEGEVENWKALRTKPCIKHLKIKVIIVVPCLPKDVFEFSLCPLSSINCFQQSDPM